MSSTDVESLQPVAGQRSRCLDAFLLGSVITLSVMVLSGAALGFWLVKDLRADINRFHHEPVRARQISDSRVNFDSFYQTQNFAYLTANSSELKNGSMQWVRIKYGNTTTIGSRYRYDSEHGVLTMVQGGAYFLYTQLNLTCTFSCAKGSVTLTFEDNLGNEHLSCTLDLPKTTSIPSVKKCWTVIPRLLPNSRLMARMRANVPKFGWKLDLNHSGFGMFLVEGPKTE